MSTPPPPPHRVGMTYCFTDVRVRVGVGVSVTPITKGTHVHFFGRHVFCDELDLCSQGQVVRAFFIGMGFLPNFVKGDFDYRCQKAS